MTVIVGWIVSVAAVVATLLVVRHLAGLRKRTDAPVSSWVAYDVGMFAAVFAFVLSQEIVGLAGSEGSPILLDSLFNSLQMFGLNRDIELDTDALSFLGVARPLYLVYNAALYLATPVGTIGTILSLLSQLFVTFRMKGLARTRDVFAFSTLNDRSLALAKSAQQAYENDGKDCLVVFADVEEDAALASEAKGSDMMCLSQSIGYVANSIGKGSMKHTFVFSDMENEVANLSDGIDLAYKLSDMDCASATVPQVLMFSNSPVGGPVVDAAAGEVNVVDENDPRVRVGIKRVDWIRSTVNTLLDKYPLFATGITEACMHGDEFAAQLSFDPERQTRHILIVGDGAFAKEFLKGALWATQLGTEITSTIDVVSATASELADQLAFDAPEFSAADGRPYQNFYALNFHATDPESGAYLDFLRASKERGGLPTYILVAYDDDLVCAKVARRTREVLEQAHLAQGIRTDAAFIAAVINDAELAKTMLRMEAKDRLYAIQPVGDTTAIYSYDTIFAFDLDRSARNLNRMYSCSWMGVQGPELVRALDKADLEYANSEYNQRSSVASALHRKYSLFLFCRKVRPDYIDKIDWTAPLALGAPGTKGYSQELSDLIDAYDAYFDSGEALWLSEVEHDRWAAYTSSEGFECVRLVDLEKIYQAENRHEFRLGRLHPCLMRFDDLPMLDEAAREHRAHEPLFQAIDNIVLQNTRLIIAADEKSFLAEWDRKFGASDVGPAV